MYRLFLLLLCVLNAQAAVRIGIISDSACFGEREVGWRIKLAAQALGWTAFLDEERGAKIRHLKNLDWVICLIPNSEHLNLHCPNYMALFHPFGYFDKERNLRAFYERYDAYLITIKPERLKSQNKKPLWIPFYPTLPSIEYRQLELNNLTTMIPVWGNRKKEEKFIDLYESLERSGFTTFLSQIPFDGISLVRALQEHGIVLIIHSKQHNRAEIPSSRIFEAAAASTVIICDENPFIKAHFGDSVYYIDTNLSANEIYVQISKHMDIIRRDPESALKKAKQAHDIFKAKFLMTQQLLEVQAMHEEIKSKKRKKT